MAIHGGWLATPSTTPGSVPVVTMAIHINTSIMLYLAVIHLIFPLCSYFETYGCIPELNNDHSEKFTAMRKVSDISTVHKGDNTCVSTGHCTTVTVFYRAEC